ncbi:MAG: hypothetical protein ABIP75_10815 [Pyrinomonadaceae bacterium]
MFVLALKIKQVNSPDIGKMDIQVAITSALTAFLFRVAYASFTGAARPGN